MDTKQVGHTPGPWETFPDPKNSIHGTKTVYVIPSAPGPTIATVHGHGVGPAHDAEVDAYARLIAAAPELLEALDKAREALRHFTHDDEDRERRRISAVNAVRAAIAKATGSAQ